MTDDPLLALITLGIILVISISFFPTKPVEEIPLHQTSLKQDLSDGFIRADLGVWQPPTPALASLGDPFSEYHSVYYKGVRMSELLTCLWLNESSYGKNMYGDYWNGKPLAYGHFQIHLWQHPEVSYDCAMDLDCSARYTSDEILEGRLWQWTTGNACIK